MLVKLQVLSQGIDDRTDVNPLSGELRETLLIIPTEVVLNQLKTLEHLEVNRRNLSNLAYPSAFICVVLMQFKDQNKKTFKLNHFAQST